MKHNQIAREYFPGITPQSASIQLGRWIVRNGELRTKLMAAGWQPHQKIYTPKQVEIIREVLE